MNARFVDGMRDASSQSVIDPSGRLPERGESSRPARQPGARWPRHWWPCIFFNSNALSAAVTTALKETSVYYLLAWRPKRKNSATHGFAAWSERHWPARIAGASRAALGSRVAVGPTKTPPEAANRNAWRRVACIVRAPYPHSSLPVSVTANFVDTAQRGSVLVVALKVATNQLVFEWWPERRRRMSIWRALYRRPGKMMSSLEKRLTLKSNSANVNGPPPESLFYNHFSVIKPGLYECASPLLKRNSSRRKCFAVIRIPISPQIFGVEQFD